MLGTVNTIANLIWNVATYHPPTFFYSKDLKWEDDISITLPVECVHILNDKVKRGELRCMKIDYVTKGGSFFSFEPPGKQFHFVILLDEDPWKMTPNLEAITITNDPDMKYIIDKIKKYRMAFIKFIVTPNLEKTDIRKMMDQIDVGIQP